MTSAAKRTHAYAVRIPRRDRAARGTRRYGRSPGAGTALPGAQGLSGAASTRAGPTASMSATDVGAPVVLGRLLAVHELLDVEAHARGQRLGSFLSGSPYAPCNHCASAL